MLVPSFSSKVSPKLDQLVELAAEFITEQVLVSAYDIYHKKLKIIPTFASLIFLDSGGYECSEQADLSEIGYSSAEPEKGLKKAAKQQKKWREEEYCAVVTTWATNLEGSHIVIVSYDHPDKRQPVHEQIASAERLLSQRDDIMKEILVKPDKKENLYLNIEEIILNIKLLQVFDIVGVTEKELGKSVLERMVNIARIRLAMEKEGFTRPLHIFGSLDPLSTPLYFASGADIFDGLTWLRYSFVDGYGVYWQNIAARKWPSAPISAVLRKNMIDNYYYLIELRDQMTTFVHDGDFRNFDKNAKTIKKVYRSLESKLSRMKEV
jgi:hypothetical protein